MSVSGGGATNVAWSHTNVYAAGKLLATYDLTNKRLHFYLDDPRPPADCNVLMQHRAETNCYCGSALSGLPPKLRREW